MKITIKNIFLLSLITISASANAEHNNGKIATFRDFEFEFPESQRVEAARSSLLSAIPIGTSLENAREALHKRGAHCGKVDGSGHLVCTSGAMDAPDNFLRDIIWRVEIASKNNRVVAINVGRSTRGG